jgi:methylthioribulose-1-phosphate dehydratase
MKTIPGFTVAAEQLAEVARWSYRNGWAPATSTNYSVRLPNEAMPALCAITSSGVDKEHLGTEHVLAIDHQGRPVTDTQLIPSAETALHLMLYRTMHAGAVLHTHSLAATLLSQRTGEQGHLLLSGWELLKGLEGIDTHECTVQLPVFPNAQDIPRLATLIESTLTAAPASYGFLLAGHGLYVWGRDLAEAKRHLETFEFILQCELEIRRHGYTSSAGPAYVSHR